MILPKLGNPKRRNKLRFLIWFNGGYYPHEFFKLLKFGWSWSILKKDEDSVTVLTPKKFNVCLKTGYLDLMMNEWPIWKKYYAFPFNLNGKTVLDAGAGCGETALFFFLNGAKKVIAIEKNAKLLPYLKQNQENNNWNMEIINDSFRLEYLDINFDACKMDIEGGEETLLQLKNIDFPLILEVHSFETKKRFQEKGFSEIFKLDKTTTIMNNFKSLLNF